MGFYRRQHAASLHYFSLCGQFYQTYFCGLDLRKNYGRLWAVMCNCAIHCVLMSAVSRHSSFVWFYVLDLYL
ncbi:hypothetical protein T08_2320 [Trichinella sp. T8]|uniref:Uncharacterized protein n=1 Tax=Trichinella murrelli TaxID=144512 RepID=A0A0V0TRS9_9BILA|nr:hypothetical protein T05_12848 [Trichinella murrelli]KRZ84061.1 hypothetical protein T08_2320 [Trichinella sp. T8]